MKIAIMQPYFFPYIGYFQLIDSVDIYVNLDHVSFMKSSYMTRNKLKNGININIPIKKASQNKKCIESFVLPDPRIVNKFKKTIENLYGKEPEFEQIYKYLFGDESVWKNNLTISQFNLHFIKLVCNYLEINTKIIESSEGITTKEKEKGLQEIVNALKGETQFPTYVNAIGGIKIYTKKNFEINGIDLKFIKMDSLDFEDEYTSILDLLFRYKKEFIIEQLKKYTLI